MGFFGDIIKSVAGPVLGGLLDQQGQENANATNIDLANQTNAFNAAEAAKQRTWSAEQADLTRGFNRREATTAYLRSGREAYKTRSWAERLSNTAHQREIKDLQAAGLNPILSSRYGGSSTPGGPTGSAPAASASTPSGASASGVLAKVENSLGKGVSSAISARNAQNMFEDMKATVAYKNAQTNLTNAQGAKTDAETGKIIAETDNANATYGQITANTAKAVQERKNLQETLTKLKEESKNAALQGKISQKELDLYEQRIKKAEADARTATVDAEIAEMWGQILAIAKPLIPAGSALANYLESKANRKQKGKQQDADRKQRERPKSRNRIFHRREDGQMEGYEDYERYE